MRTHEPTNSSMLSTSAVCEYSSGSRKVKGEEFVYSFADELAQGKPTAADTLSNIIQIGFMFDFNESEVDFLLMKHNLELLVADVQFLDYAFPASGTPAVGI